MLKSVWANFFYLPFKYYYCLWTWTLEMLWILRIGRGNVNKIPIVEVGLWDRNVECRFGIDVLNVKVIRIMISHYPRFLSLSTWICFFHLDLCSRSLMCELHTKLLWFSGCWSFMARGKKTCHIPLILLLWDHLRSSVSCGRRLFVFPLYSDHGGLIILGSLGNLPLFRNVFGLNTVIDNHHTADLNLLNYPLWILISNPQVYKYSIC